MAMVHGLNVLTPALLLALLPMTQATARCSAPYPPAVPQAGIATGQQLEELKGDVQAFMQASDVYQTCVLDAENDGSMLTVVASSEVAKDQHQKEQVGAAFNAAVSAFKLKVASK